MATYVKSINSLSDTIKKHSEIIKKLKDQRKDYENKLYIFMKKNNMEIYEGIKIEKIQPKEKSERKKAKEKRAETVRLFSEIGVDDPDELFKLTESIRKSKIPIQKDED
jgi:hypothetical protein